jgi:hypothetical protein
LVIKGRQFKFNGNSGVKVRGRMKDFKDLEGRVAIFEDTGRTFKVGEEFGVDVMAVDMEGLSTVGVLTWEGIGERDIIILTSTKHSSEICILKSFVCLDV